MATYKDVLGNWAQNEGMDVDVSSMSGEEARQWAQTHGNAMDGETRGKLFYHNQIAPKARKTARNNLGDTWSSLNPLAKRAAIVDEKIKALTGNKYPNFQGTSTQADLLKDLTDKRENIQSNMQYNSAVKDYQKVQGQKDLSSKAVSDPQSLTPKAEVAKIDPNTEGTNLDPNLANINAPDPKAKRVKNPEVATVGDPNPMEANTYDASKVTGKIKGQNYDPAQGKVSGKAQVKAAQGELSDEAIAESLGVDPEYIKQVRAGKLKVTDDQLVKAQGQKAKAAQADFEGIDTNRRVDVAQGEVTENQLVDAETMDPDTVAQAGLVNAEELREDAKTKAVTREDGFSVDDGTLAAFKEGKIEAVDTVQGQLAKLMKDFDDGTPEWAAGALRNAHAAMAARGLGRSSMAGAALTQAAMEAAIPIAQADAQAFREMKLNNLNRQTQISLANAAAQQGLELQNLNNEQQAALQKSINAAGLQTAELSAHQSAMIANAQMKAAIQGKNLDNKQQSAILNAARFAENANINLNFQQQGLLQESAQSLQADIANMSEKQKTALANAQIEAALQGKKLDFKQQAAVLNAARISEASNIEFSAEENAKLHNSTLMQTIGTANLNAEMAATLQNAAQWAGMDMANLNNRQQARVQNANAFLSMDMSNLNNEQQAAMFKMQSITQGLLSDQAQDNAAKQFNATSENQTEQFFAQLKSTIGMHDSSQKNAMAQSVYNAENARRQFNTEMQEARNKFESEMGLVISQANATWRQNVATIDTAAENVSIRDSVLASYGITESALDNIWQRDRDIMSFAFQAFENQADRDMRVFLGEKELEEYDKQRRAENMRGLGRIVGGLLFGDGGFF